MLGRPVRPKGKPQANASASSGNIELKRRITRQQQTSSVTGNLTLADFTGRYGNDKFQNFGTSVDLELSLPYVSGEQPIRISAVVRNRNGFRYGLEYLSLSDPDKQRLLKSLKALSLTR